MARKKKIEDEDFPLYIVSRKLKKGKSSYEDIDCFTDYDEAADFVDMDRQVHPEYLYRIDEF